MTKHFQLAMSVLVPMLVSLAVSGASAGSRNGKKLIEYGWDAPDTRYVREHVREMEKVPFDGVVIGVKSPEPYLWWVGWRVWSKDKVQPWEYEKAIDDLNAAKFQRFTDNFIQVVSCFLTPEVAVDWFDRRWSVIAYNTACMAKVAKQSGCKGIMFDPEEYNEQTRIWSYAKGAGHSYEEYAAKVRERGKEFIRALNREYPGITILVLHGYEVPFTDPKLPPESRIYPLLAPFLDGMCQAADSGTTIIDGFERSYGCVNRKLFADGRTQVMQTARSLSSAPDAFGDHVRMGFAVWADAWSAQIPFSTDDPSGNAWSPGMFRTALANAMSESDRYVWVYSERLRWWDETSPNAPANAPRAYIDALSLARRGPSPDTSKYPDVLPRH